VSEGLKKHNRQQLFYPKKKAPNSKSFMFSNWNPAISTFAAFIAAAAAIGSAIVAYWQWDIANRSLAALEKQIDLGSKSLLASQRAWIAPTTILTNSELETNKDLVGKLLYKNVGKEPAANVLTIATFGQALNDLNSIGSSLGSDSQNYCTIALKSSNRNFTAYPSEATSYEVSIRNLMNIDSKLVTTGSVVIYVLGCIAYDSYGTSHQSAFCMFREYDAVKPWKEWEWKFCPYGNFAN
jgi:hypothetical protein